MASEEVKPEVPFKLELEDTDEVQKQRFMTSMPIRYGCKFTGWMMNVDDIPEQQKYSKWLRHDQKWVPHGKGDMKCIDEETFSGQWEHGYFHGKGLWSSLHGSDGIHVYEGDFNNDKFTGTGQWHFKSNNTYSCIYEGGWKENTRQGWGKQSCQDPKIFESFEDLRVLHQEQNSEKVDYNFGFFEDNQFTGVARYKDEIKERVGEFKKGELDGHYIVKEKTGEKPGQYIYSHAVGKIHGTQFHKDNEGKVTEVEYIKGEQQGEWKDTADQESFGTQWSQIVEGFGHMEGEFEDNYTPVTPIKTYVR